MTSIFLSIALLITALLGSDLLPEWLFLPFMLAQGFFIGLGYIYEYCVISKVKSLEERIKQLKTKNERDSYAK